MTRDEICTEARRFRDLKTKWRHMGRNEQALDCLGLLVMIAKKFEIPYVEPEENYRRTPDSNLLVEMLTSQLILRRPPLKIGMAVALRDKVQPVHVGIIGERYGELSLIHACASRGYVYEEPWANWSSRLRMCLDFPGVED